MKHIGKALVAGLVALGMMMAGAVTANAADFSEGYISVTPGTVTASTIGNLNLKYSVEPLFGGDNPLFNGDAILTVVPISQTTPECPTVDGISGSHYAYFDDGWHMEHSYPDSPSSWWTPAPNALDNPTACDSYGVKFKGRDNQKYDGPVFQQLVPALTKWFADSSIKGVKFYINNESDVIEYWSDDVLFDRSSQGSGSESTPGSFSDVTDKTPHAADIKWLAEKKIAEGYKDGTFAPSGTVNRQDMAAFLYRLAGSPDFTPDWSKNPFADVSEGSDHAKEVLWLAQSGISKGYVNNGVTTFDGTAGVQRQDMAAFLKRLADLEQAASPSGEGKQFTDVNADTPHAEDIAWLAKTGVSEGYGNGSFGVGGTVLRQDMAAFLHRMNDNVLKK